MPAENSFPNSFQNSSSLLFSPPPNPLPYSICVKPHKHAFGVNMATMQAATNTDKNSKHSDDSHSAHSMLVITHRHMPFEYHTSMMSTTHGDLPVWLCPWRDGRPPWPTPLAAHSCQSPRSWSHRELSAAAAPGFADSPVHSNTKNLNSTLVRFLCYLLNAKLTYLTRVFLSCIVVYKIKGMLLNEHSLTVPSC